MLFKNCGIIAGFLKWKDTVKMAIIQTLFKISGRNAGNFKKDVRMSLVKFRAVY